MRPVVLPWVATTRYTSGHVIGVNVRAAHHMETRAHSAITPRKPNAVPETQAHSAILLT